ncbi:Ankyrin repeat and DHHC-type Zn-finger domain containing protein [Pseudoloma neurophilia]|uniref:Palmitoyltransferase n=1 Tax=Pseudoloma neurophilia TaxID=146866 RepID=A0A0R0LZQ2_9MICR|nr:Ankyrin repeat and DHHC-type Zn-finger domain containing protein [Pseudoloma neurophilia]
MSELDKIIKKKIREDKPVRLDHIFENGLTVLHYACLYGKLKVVKQYIDNEMEINPKGGEFKTTPLYFSIYNKNHRITLFILLNGACDNPEGKNLREICVKLGDYHSLLLTDLFLLNERNGEKYYEKYYERNKEKNNEKEDERNKEKNNEKKDQKYYEKNNEKYYEKCYEKNYEKKDERNKEKYYEKEDQKYYEKKDEINKEKNNEKKDERNKEKCYGKNNEKCYEKEDQKNFDYQFLKTGRETTQNLRKLASDKKNLNLLNYLGREKDKHSILKKSLCLMIFITTYLFDQDVYSVLILHFLFPEQMVEMRAAVFLNLCYTVEIYVRCLIFSPMCIILLILHSILLYFVLYCKKHVKKLNKPEILLNIKTAIEKDAFNDSYFCYICGKEKKISTKHCYYCNICVENFDHHCPCINGCVNGNNFYLYHFYLIYSMILLIFCNIKIDRSIRTTTLAGFAIFVCFLRVIAVFIKRRKQKFSQIGILTNM